MKNGSYTLYLRKVGSTNLDIDVYSSSLKVEVALFVSANMINASEGQGLLKVY